VCHLFGGLADFGFRVDLDPDTKPDLVGDAFLPGLPRDSFDDVILDPPYYRMGQQEKIALLRAACWVARRYVWWFHTVWIAADRTLQLDRAWLVRAGDHCAVRTLQRFKVCEPKHLPLDPSEFTRGHPLIYKRWCDRSKKGNDLPFPDLLAGDQIGGPEQMAPAPRGVANQRTVTNGVYMGDW
jgi:hypothetical protein